MVYLCGSVLCRLRTAAKRGSETVTFSLLVNTAAISETSVSLNLAREYLHINNPESFHTEEHRCADVGLMFHLKLVQAILGNTGCSTCRYTVIFGS